MELEMQGIAQNIRSSYNTRLVSAKAELSRFKKALAEAHSQLTRADLLGAAGRPASTYPSSDDPYSDRARLLAGTSVLEQGTKRLQDSQRLALETEMQGADILTNLRGQREQIENSRSTLDRADLAIDRASSTLKQMVRRCVVLNLTHRKVIMAPDFSDSHITGCTNSEPSPTPLLPSCCCSLGSLSGKRPLDKSPQILFDTYQLEILY